jgi:uncharacterized protein YfiM (DUF2279 family)
MSGTKLPQPRPMARQALRAICTLLIMLAGALVLSCITATPAHAADSWTGADKGKHAAVGALISGSALQLTGDARLALVAGTAAAIGKELVDMHRTGHTASYRDAAVTVAGALFAAQAPGLLITPISVSYRIQW